MLLNSVEVKSSGLVWHVAVHMKVLWLDHGSHKLCERARTK